MGRHTHMKLEVLDEGKPTKVSIVNALVEIASVKRDYAKYADFIVVACNNHYKLLDALKELLERVDACNDSKSLFEINFDEIVDAKHKAWAAIEAVERGSENENASKYRISIMAQERNWRGWFLRHHI